MKPVSLIDVSSYLPGPPVAVDFYASCDDGDGHGDPLRDNPMFRAPAFRHHVDRSETAADMVERACQPLAERLGASELRTVDVVITNVLLPDMLITGCGAEVAHRLGARPEWVIDLHNGGCASFVYMLRLARTILQATPARSALLCTVQNSAGQVFAQPEVRIKAHATVPGDGCGVAYLAASDDAPILAVATRNMGEHAADMALALDDGRKFWEPGSSQIDVSFTEAKVAKIIARGNRLVPELVKEVCAQIDVPSRDIDVLVTNQPNRMFLRNWREALELPAERHLDTFDQFGNLFGAAIPVTLDHARADERLPADSLMVLAGFAHAGDFAAAAAVRWHPSSN